MGSRKLFLSAVSSAFESYRQLLAQDLKRPSLDVAVQEDIVVKLIGGRRCLLVLDGLEPLQYPPGAMHGMLKDPGMAALLRGLAGKNEGLCVVTTRERVDEIKQHYGVPSTTDILVRRNQGARSTDKDVRRTENPGTCIDHPLEFLSPLAGAALLHFAGARRAGDARCGPRRGSATSRRSAVRYPRRRGRAAS